MWRKIIQKQFLKKDKPPTFVEYQHQKIDYRNINNLYIHIPFCRNTCPYCPYFKEKFEPEKAEKTGIALIKEIELHADHLKGKKIDSLYIGGGTPTLMNETLGKAIDLLRSFCTIEKIAIETNPQEINEKVLSELEQMNCNLISLGIQDFNQKHLDCIGRKYNTQTGLKAIEQVKNRDFDTVNIDLIFAFPQQTIEELDETLEKAIACDVEQITLYPLFTFPYSSIGKFNSLKKIILPNSSQRKQFYFHIYDKLLRNGYQQISVWGFLKQGKTKYSSVTRDYYLGLGPSAASYTGKQFLFNSFNSTHYHHQIDTGKIPYSMVMEVSENLEKLFWIYWRLYETKIPLKDYTEKFSADFKKDYPNMVTVLNALKYTNPIQDCISLNKKGIHRIHLLQNHFALNYVNQIWSASTQTSPPKKIILS
jgi:oxygen-independent coproporphyrinogen-3 oxidase